MKMIRIILLYISLPLILLRALILTALLKSKLIPLPDPGAHLRFRSGIYTFSQIREKINRAKTIISIDLASLKLSHQALLEILTLLLKHKDILQSIKISNNPHLFLTNESLDTFLDLLTQFKQLTEIDLSYNGLKGEATNIIAYKLSQQCSNLRNLDLEANDIDIDFAISLAQFPFAINLKSNDAISTPIKMRLATQIDCYVLNPNKIYAGKHLTYTFKTLRNPIEIHNIYLNRSHYFAVPSLKELSLFKVKSDDKLLAQVNILPEDLQMELRKEMRFDL